MAATKAYIATPAWVLTERQNAFTLTQAEREEAFYPAINHVQWLNEHMDELYNKAKVQLIQAFKTPGKLRGLKTPAFKHTGGLHSSKKTRGLLPLHENNLQDAFGGPSEPTNLAPHVETVDICMPDASGDAHELLDDDIEMLVAIEEPTKDKENDSDPTPQPESPVQLYTESDIGSPSMHATPEKPFRKGSFTFAPLPARDPLKQSIGPQSIENKPPQDAAPATVHQPEPRKSLGLDSDDDNSDNESLDLRAPELIAHEERMKAYESSPVHRAESPESEHFESAEDTPVAPKMMDVMEVEQPEGTGPTTTEELDDMGAEAPKEQPLEAPKPQVPRARAPKTAIGRPHRPSNKPKQPEPTTIKYKSISQKPINTAPVAAHNQDAGRPQPQTELRRKPSAAFTTPAAATQKTSKPIAPPKALSAAQKKKEQDEAKAAKEAALAQAKRERRDNKIKEIQRKKLEEQEELDRKARENSAEKAKKHVTTMDAQEIYRQKAERSQEREQQKADADKQSKKDQQQMRATQPQGKPILQSALKCAVPKPSTFKPITTISKTGTSRPPNPVARPPARLEQHEASRPASRLELRDDDMHDGHDTLPTYPSNLSKPPVRASIKKPSIFTQTSQAFPQPPARAGPSMQQFATQKIPFAAPSAPSHHQSSSAQTQQPRPQPKSGLNTPYSIMHSMQTIQTISGTSPSDMTLPEIHTDSSDDSNDNRSAASWTTPGHLMPQLASQETVNPDHLFGQMQGIAMEEVFQNNPRMARLRDRTSSANWVRSGDALTSTEIVRDQRARTAIREAGGWIFNIEEH